MKPLPRLYAIADATFGNPVNLAKSLFEGGARLVQVRNKKAGAREFLTQVEEILKMAPEDACVIANDRVDIALIAGAGGVHLGQTDLDPALARTILSHRRIIGWSTHNLEQALRADQSAADYIAAGPVFSTQTKPGAEPAIGFDGLREICARVHKPVVAIGGITLDSAADVLACGASSVAAISGLVGGGDVVQKTKEWVERLGSPLKLDQVDGKG